MTGRSRAPLLVLAVSLAVTVAMTALVALGIRSRDQARFENAVQAAHDRISGRLETYITVLRGVAGLFDASGNVTREEFHDYVNRLDLPHLFPGVQGVGFSLRVDPANLPQTLEVIRNDNAPGFHLWPEAPRAEYHTVLYLEPQDRRNQAALGFDMFTDPIRREAMERARDTGDAAMTGRVILVQEIEGPKQPGFLIYVPVYRGGTVPPTVEERRQKLLGFVYSPFRAGDLFNKIFGTESEPRVALSVYDERVAPETLLHDEHSQLARHHAPGFTTVEDLTVAGRPWKLVIRSLPSLDETFTRFLPPAVAIGGLLVSFLIFGVVMAQVRARSNADAERQVATTLSRMGLVFASERNPEHLVQRLTDEATALTGADYGAYFHNIPNEEGRYGLYTLSGAPREAFVNMPPVRTTSLFGHTFLGKGTLRLDDVHQSDLYGHNPPYNGMPEGHLPVVSYLAVPVRGRTGKVLGGLFFAHHEPGRFRPEHEKLVEGLAAQAAVALDNARLYQEAQQAIHLRDEFLSVASHELKTPLTPLQLRLEVVAQRAEQEPDSEFRRQVLAAISTSQRQVHRLSRLVSDLLDVSRITSGRMNLVRSEVDLVALTHEMVSRFEPQAARSQTKLTLDAPAPVIGSWDPARIEQVLTNLLENGLKYAAGKSVHVEVTRTDGSARLRVIDEGIGIDPERLPQIFGRFERAVSERHYGGLGLGLYITQQIVQAHGGSIRAESTPGVRTVFTVELPLNPG